MHPKSPCRFVVTPTPKLSEQQYALRLVVIPCQYFSSMLPFFQPISPSLSSHISSVAVPHILRRRINTCRPASPPPCLSTAVFTDDLLFHPHYPGATIHPQVGSRSLSIFSQSAAVLTTHFAISAVPHILRRPIDPCCPAYLPPWLSTAVFAADLVCHIFLPCLCCGPYQILFHCYMYFAAVVCLTYTVWSSTQYVSLRTTLLCYALLRITFITLCYDLLNTLLFSLLERLFSLSVMF